MSPPNEETRRFPAAGSTKVLSATEGKDTTNPRRSVLEHSIDLLTEIFAAALDLDQGLRQTVEAWQRLSMSERIQLADRHPGLAEALLRLENRIDRRDRPW